MEILKGIVLRTVKYGDNGHIVDMFTNSRGRMSFMMKRNSGNNFAGPNNRFGSIVPSLFMPLSMLEFNCDVHNHNRLPQPKDVRLYNQYHSIQINPIKSIISLFIAEFLVHVLKEEGENPLLYGYLENSLKWLDSSEKGYTNFHLVLLMRVTRFVGIYPNLDKPYSNNSNGTKSIFFYDLINSEYRYDQPNHIHYLRPEEAEYIPYLLYMNYENMHLYSFSRRQRQRCLEVINDYYRLHLPGFGELKSLEVIKEIFN